MKTRYLIDTCSLIALEEHYNPNNIIFKLLWDRLHKLLESNDLLICSEVYDELKDGSIRDTLKPYSKSFIPLTKEVQERTKEILNECPGLIKLQSKGNSGADPFLLAIADLNKFTIITEEHYDVKLEKDPHRYNIPKVCTQRRIKYMKLSEFLGLDIINSDI